ncbi:MAG TPA: DUF6567 family protein [Planctomycetota bacterium]|nr:DUF6567 family protein [Planctomycetota bacterium]
MNRLVFIVLPLAVFISGCAASGSFPHASTTNVSLAQDNYLVVKSNVIGNSSGFKLLGLLPLSAPRYTAAMADLYENASIREGRAYALTNVIQERSTTYIILFSVPRLTVRADIVEFMNENEKIRWQKAHLPQE